MKIKRYSTAVPIRTPLLPEVSSASFLPSISSFQPERPATSTGEQIQHDKGMPPHFITIRTLYSFQSTFGAWSPTLRFFCGKCSEEDAQDLSPQQTSLNPPKQTASVLAICSLMYSLFK
jgi:hypothetical protein